MVAISKHLNRQIASARVEQIERVNETPEQLLRRVNDLEERVSQLRQAIRQRDQRIFELEMQIDSDSEVSQVDRASDDPGQRPTITAHEAALKTRVGYHTVCRYLRSGWWQGEKDDYGHWHVYADQALTPKARGRRKQVKHT